MFHKLFLAAYNGFIFQMRDVLNGKAQHFVPDNSSSHNKSENIGG